MIRTHRRSGILVAAAGVLLSVAASASTLDAIRARDTLRCGVSEGIAGFSIRDGQSRWSGLDVDFCRAVAAAVFGDAGRVTFVPLRASERFPALRLAQIDLLARNTTWTLTREAGLGVLFAGVLLYDGQGFLVPAQPPIVSAAHLSGAVCVEKSTTHVDQLADWARGHDVAVTPLVLDSAPEAAAAFFAGRCIAYTSDISTLAAARAVSPNPAGFTLLADQISKDPLGPVVRAGDDQWFTLVRWVLFALIAAEEADLTQQTVASLRDHPNPAAARVVGADRELARLLGVAPEWSIRAVEAGGNYGELFERNVGRDSPLGLERGINRLWNRGGILYAPPLR